MTTNDAPSGQIVDAPEIVGDAARGDTGTVPSPTAPLALDAAAPVEPAPTNPSDRRVVGGPPFATLLEFAKALNRLDRTALELAARDPLPDMPIDGLVVKKLLGTFWFREIFPRLSPSWRERLFETFVGSVVIPNHVLWRGRHTVHLAGSSYAELKEIAARTMVSGAAGTDLQLLLTIASLWGEEALGRLRFIEMAEPESSSRLGARLGLRG